MAAIPAEKLAVATFNPNGSIFFGGDRVGGLQDRTTPSYSAGFTRGTGLFGLPSLRVPNPSFALSIVTESATLHGYIFYARTINPELPTVIEGGYRTSESGAKQIGWRLEGQGNNAQATHYRRLVNAPGQSGQPAPTSAPDGWTAYVMRWGGSQATFGAYPPEAGAPPLWVDSVSNDGVYDSTSKFYIELANVEIGYLSSITETSAEDIAEEFERLRSSTSVEPPAEPPAAPVKIFDFAQLAELEHHRYWYNPATSGMELQTRPAVTAGAPVVSSPEEGAQLFVGAALPLLPVSGTILLMARAAQVSGGLLNFTSPSDPLPNLVSSGRAISLSISNAQFGDPQQVMGHLGYNGVHPDTGTQVTYAETAYGTPAAAPFWGDFHVFRLSWGAGRVQLAMDGQVTYDAGTSFAPVTLDARQLEFQDLIAVRLEVWENPDNDPTSHVDAELAMIALGVPEEPSARIYSRLHVEGVADGQVSSAFEEDENQVQTSVPIYTINMDAMDGGIATVSPNGPLGRSSMTIVQDQYGPRLVGAARSSDDLPVAPKGMAAAVFLGERTDGYTVIALGNGTHGFELVHEEGITSIASIRCPGYEGPASWDPWMPAVPLPAPLELGTWHVISMRYAPSGAVSRFEIAVNGTVVLASDYTPSSTSTMWKPYIGITESNPYDPQISHVRVADARFWSGEVSTQEMYLNVATYHGLTVPTTGPVTITWDAPSDNSFPVTEYRVRTFAGGKLTDTRVQVAEGAARTFTLPEDYAGPVQVVAVGAFGRSTPIEIVVG